MRYYFPIHRSKKTSLPHIFTINNPAVSIASPSGEKRPSLLGPPSYDTTYIITYEIRRPRCLHIISSTARDLWRRAVEICFILLRLSARDKRVSVQVPRAPLITADEKIIRLLYAADAEHVRDTSVSSYRTGKKQRWGGNNGRRYRART